MSPIRALKSLPSSCHCTRTVFVMALTLSSFRFVVLAAITGAHLIYRVFVVPRIGPWLIVGNVSCNFWSDEWKLRHKLWL